MNRSAHNDYEWALSVFTARESLPTLRDTIAAAIIACAKRRAIIDVLVNGNAQLAAEVPADLTKASLPPSIAIRVWHFPIPDKAASWNTYIHELWPTAKVTFFIDGYATVAANSLEAIALRLSEDPKAACATGVPTDGWSARSLRKSMLRQHGIHGNLFAMPRPTVESLRRLPFRLPKGIYRNDSTIALGFSLDPSCNDWEPEKLLVVPEATWRLPKRSRWSVAELKGRWMRRIRQARGDFENRAIKKHFAEDRLSPARLPLTVNELVDDWLAACPTEAQALMRRSWRHRKALEDLRQSEPRAVLDPEPTLVHSVSDKST